jgi:hypothetical protein
MEIERGEESVLMNHGDADSDWYWRCDRLAGDVFSYKGEGSYNDIGT